MEYRGGFRAGAKHGKGKLVNSDGRMRDVTFSEGNEVKEKEKGVIEPVDCIPTQDADEGEIWNQNTNI